jgi:hypothetical protein
MAFVVCLLLGEQKKNQNKTKNKTKKQKTKKQKLKKWMFVNLKFK